MSLIQFSLSSFDDDAKINWKSSELSKKNSRILSRLQNCTELHSNSMLKIASSKSNRRHSLFSSDSQFNIKNKNRHSSSVCYFVLLLPFFLSSLGFSILYDSMCVNAVRSLCGPMHNSSIHSRQTHSLNIWSTRAAAWQRRYRLSHTWNRYQMQMIFVRSSRMDVSIEELRWQMCRQLEKFYELSAVVL